MGFVKRIARWLWDRPMQRRRDATGLRAKNTDSNLTPDASQAVVEGQFSGDGLM